MTNIQAMSSIITRTGAALIVATSLTACQAPNDGPTGRGAISNSTSPVAPPGLRPRPNAGAPLPTGFLCCNMHFDGDWISDSNYPTLSVIAVGTPARAIEYGNNRFSADVGGHRMRFGLDYGRAEPLPAYAAKVIVPEDPRPKIASFPPDIQRAINDGRLMVGMTREQVLMAIGYPQTDENPDLGARVWRYWVDWQNEYQVAWDPTGKVREVTGTAAALARIRAPSP